MPKPKDDTLDRTLAASYAWRGPEAVRVPEPLPPKGERSPTACPEAAPTTDSEAAPTADPAEVDDLADDDLEDGDDDLADGEDDDLANGDEDGDGDGDDEDGDEDWEDEDEDGEDGDDEFEDGEDGPEDPSVAEEAHRKMREEAFRGVAALAKEVDRCWYLSGAELRHAVVALMAQAHELGIGLAAMQHHPLQSVRLMRLIARAWPLLSAKEQREVFGLTMWLDVSHPELSELVIESSLAETEVFLTLLNFGMDQPLWKRLRKDRSLGERMARLLDETPSERACVVALWWEFSIGHREIIPALRRLLRRPSYELRYRALRVIEYKYPEVLQEEDVMILLAGIIEQEPPDVTEHTIDLSFELPEFLHKAIVRLRPRAAIPLLLQMTRWEYADEFRQYLDVCWALQVLAAAFPQDALPHIDALQRRVEYDRRLYAAHAAALLPDDEAWPRLLRAAADAIPSVAKIAEDTWLKRRGQPCPREPTAGLVVSLLQGPLSERALDRLGVLRRGPREASAAIAEVLLGEAPDREALVLLLFLFTDDLLLSLRLRPSLPDQRTKLCMLLCERFGPPAVEGILELARMFPDGRWGWFSSLVDVLVDGKLPVESRPLVRAAAEEHFLRTTGFIRLSAMTALEILGAPAEFADALAAIAADESLKPYERKAAAQVLANLSPGPRSG